MNTAIAPTFRIERATAADIPLILRLIHGIAEYEQLAHEVVATEERLRASLFGPHPAAEAVIAYADTEPVGFAVYFPNFSTVLGQPGLYLEDLYVQPEWRKHGLGRRLMAHVANIAVERHCARMEWSVLDWNEPAIRFYRSLGARAMDEWTIYRLTGTDLQELASRGDS